MFNNVKKKYIFIAFTIYIFFTLIVMYLHENYQDMIPFSENFYISFLASSWEDIIFFGIVGFALALVSLRDPKEDIFVQRIKNLFSFTSDVDPSIETAVIDSVKKVAIYSTKNSIKLSILEYSEEFNAIKVQINQEIHLSNLLHDEPYSYSRPVDFMLDDFGENKPDILGRINEASFTDNTLNKSFFCETKRAFKKKKYSFNIEENIAKGSYGITTLNYWIWYKLDEDWNFKVHHHTAQFNISIQNDDIHLDNRLELIHENEKLSLNNHEQNLNLNEFYSINSKVHFKIRYIK